MTKWYQLSGTENDIALCTKVSLARNLRDFNFNINLDSEEKYEIAKLTEETIEKKLPGKFKTKDMRDLTRFEAISLAERNLVSPEFVSSAEGRTFMSTADESLSIMVCEEDHLKIQALLPGLELEKTHQLADHLDTMLDESLHFAFDRKLGYLTQCPGNIGTAMRASVMLQLPALRMHGRIQHLSTTVSKLGLVLTGAYGEGDNPVGSLYQLSNQVTLGISEKAALNNLNSLALSILEQERQCRAELMNNIRFQDLMWRSYGTLKNARVMSFYEFMEAIAMVKIGIAKGDIKIPMARINEMIFTLQPATINTEYSMSLDRQVRDAKRAELIREVFDLSY